MVGEKMNIQVTSVMAAKNVRNINSNNISQG